MTQEEFNELPLLLRPSQVRAATGLSDEDLRELEASGAITTYRARTELEQPGYRRFHKSEIARLLKLKY